MPWELGLVREIKDTVSALLWPALPLHGNTQSPASLEGGRMPPQPCPVLQPVQKKKSMGNSKHTGTLGPQGETSVQTCRGAAGAPRTQAAGGRVPVRPPCVFLFGSARSYFWSGVGLSLGRSRVSSLAFAPSAEKQVRMQRTRVSEQLPKRRNQAVSKAEEGRRAGAGGGGGRPVKGAVSVGDAPPRAAERGEWGTLS